MDQNTEIIIRPARAEDCSEVLEKILELARFEKMDDQCKMTKEMLLKDGGFLSDTDPKHYELLVAECKIENKLQIIGYAMWFYAWTSWEGKIGFLEDIYIDERFRRKGIARRFFNLVAKEVVKNNGAWLKLNVLGWNSNAISTYDRLGGRDLTIEKDYHIYRYDYETLKKLAENAENI